MKENLWQEEGREATNGLAMVAAIAPRKGGEAHRLWKLYEKRHAKVEEDTIPMILCDFFASSCTWPVIRSTNGQIGDLAGSLQSLLLAVDYVGALDAPATYFESDETCIAAASNAMTRLSGEAATQVLRDILITGAIIVAKDNICRSPAEDYDGSISPVNVIIPVNVKNAPWWDGAMVPYYGLLMSTSGYQEVTDNLGKPRSSKICGSTKLVLDNIVLYDEIPDLIPDFIVKEPMNEACAALTLGGSEAIYGYGDACARATDDALSCDCGANGHQEAAEMAMGFCVSYIAAPRYIVPKQLRAYSAADKVIREAYAWPPAGTRLTAVGNIFLEPGDILHTDTWRPLLKMSSPLDTCQQALADDIASRVARRCFINNPDEKAIHRVHAAASSLLIDCDTIEDIEELRQLSDKWSNLFKTVIEGTPVRSDASIATVKDFSYFIRRVWEHFVIGVTQSSIADDADLELFMELDQTFRRSNSLPATEGIPIRRAFIGVASSAIDLSGIGPYNRLSDGAARF
ncbi:hypothetical protein FE257_004469 [Aspergillus nanangensis]|uniref:Uncharacterized protein n=1 Tax=Aspergillus nanangensis TaxID=2582783 RepID=A0AAD4CYL2_ASPNN|nr:hypothetical protein FE257_004469 [Aspergillus nanangensis]